MFLCSNKPDSNSPAVEVSSKDRSKKPEKKRRRFVEAPESSVEKPKPKPSVADATPPAPAAKGEANASEPVKRARTFREKPDIREPADEPRPPEPLATALPSAAAASEPPVCESSFGFICRSHRTANLSCLRSQKLPETEFAMPAAPISSLAMKSFASPIAPAPRTRKEAFAIKSKPASKQKEAKGISSALLSVFGIIVFFSGIFVCSI